MKAQEDDWHTDPVADRLKQDALEDAGRLEKFIAGSVAPDVVNMQVLRGHRLPVTCVVISADSRFIFSASKDGMICKWNLCSCETSDDKSTSQSITCEKLGSIDGKSKKSKSKEKGHVGRVLCMALTTDFTYLATGGDDTFIHIWNPVTLEWLHTFKGHRATVSGLAFQQKQHQLFSGSHDKTLKVWNLDQMAYVETLFGHEDAVQGVAALSRNRVVTCGGRDRSVRLWKIPEESQLVFQSSQGSSFDCVTMLNDDYFLSGGDDGSLSVFFTRKKKPITLRTNAHTTAAKNNNKAIKTDSQTVDDGSEGATTTDVKDNETTGDQPNRDSSSDITDNTTDTITFGTTPPCEGWITAVASAPYTDLVASGSSDGFIRLWRCEKAFRAVLMVHEIPVEGFVNALEFSSDCEYLIAGIGQEHRLGRWWKVKEAKNSVCVIPLKKLNSAVAEE